MKYYDDYILSLENLLGVWDYFSHCVQWFQCLRCVGVSTKDIKIARIIFPFSKLIE